MEYLSIRIILCTLYICIEKAWFEHYSFFAVLKITIFVKN